MEATAAVIEVRKCDKYGKVGKVIAEVAGRYMADAMATGLQRMEHKHNRVEVLGYISCSLSRLDSIGESYSFKLER